MKICLVSSSGGHLYQLTILKRCWQKCQHFWVVFPTIDVESVLKSDRKYYAYYPESRNPVSAVRNFFLALKILTVEKPNSVISCGAGIAPPFFLAAKMLGIQTIYIEPIDFIHKPSLTGIISQYLVDLFLIQHPSQEKFFRRKVHYWGSTLDL